MKHSIYLAAVAVVVMSGGPLAVKPHSWSRLEGGLRENVSTSELAAEPVGRERDD